MNKTLTALVALSLTSISTLAMANSDAPRQGKNPAAKQAMVECRAEIGKPLPQTKNADSKRGERPKLTEQERKAMGECMSKKGFSKPEGMPFPPHGKLPVAPKAS
mgnify:CR=1